MLLYCGDGAANGLSGWLDYLVLGEIGFGCDIALYYLRIMATTIMTTEQYAKDIYSKHSKTKTASQQRIRKMIKDGNPLPQVKRIIQSGKYHLLEVLD